MTNIPAGPPEPSPVGLIGIGLLGSALAHRLLASGRRVVGFDVSAEQLAAFVRAGGTAAAHPAEVCAACSRVLLSLPSHREVAAVLEACAPSFRAGHVIIDTTTGDPASAEVHARDLSARGVVYLDATVSGSSAQTREGNAVLMVGGVQDAFAASSDLFGVLASACFFTGPSGSGARMKLVTNLVLGLNRAALAEGLALAGALGLDPDLTLEVMRRSPAYSRAMDTKGEKMIRSDFTPEARLSQHLKDVRLIIASGTEAGLPMPLSRAHRDILEAAEAAGLGGLDNSAIFRVLAARDRSFV